MNVYDFPMSVEEAVFVHDALLEMKNTVFVGTRKHFSQEKKEMLQDLIDNLGTWIENREGGE